MSTTVGTVLDTVKCDDVVITASLGPLFSNILYLCFFRWLVNCIIRDYSNLNSRVESDMAVQRKQEEQEKKERLERIRKVREERGEDIAGGITANGTCNGEVHDDSDGDIVMADPFRPIADIMVSFLSQHKHSLGLIGF